MPRPAEEVRALFADMGFEEVRLPRTIELSFERETENPDVKIRVYSAVEEGGSRECGADAGRVLLVHRESGKFVWEGRKVLRTAGYLDNMRERCREAFKVASNGLARCPVCGGCLIVRENKKTGDKFLGCCKYPACKGTRGFTNQTRIVYNVPA